jgi:enoyl-[acyl-carrier protein] reductase I
MSGILEGKRVLISGVLMESSIAFHAAKLAQEQGAEIILTAFPRPTLTERIAKKLPKPTKVIELDVTNDEHLGRLADIVGEELGGLDGVVHSIGFAPQDALGGNFLNTPFESVATAMHVSAFSLKSLTTACLPLMQNGGSVVGLTFDAQYAWPQYDWMGPAKAALEATSRYLARDLGKQNIRCNLISAGPLGSMAAKSIPGFSDLAAVWDSRSPLEWDLKDPEPAGKGIVALLSDWFPKTTGEIIHVDGGLHAIGAAGRRPVPRGGGGGASPVRPSRPGVQGIAPRTLELRTAPQPYGRGGPLVRLSRRFAPVFAAVALMMVLPYDAVPHTRVVHGNLPVPQPFGAECRTTVQGSHVTAYCHNPYPETDRVALHIECDRWWDIDTDTDPVDAGPAMTVRLAGRCWEEVRSAWVSHQK